MRRGWLPQTAKRVGTLRDFCQEKSKGYKEDDSPNPNLKKCMASVSGSAGAELYVGGSAVSAYGGGASPSITRAGATYESWRLSRVARGRVAPKKSSTGLVVAVPCSGVRVETATK